MWGISLKLRGSRVFQKKKMDGNAFLIVSIGIEYSNLKNWTNYVMISWPFSKIISGKNYESLLVKMENVFTYFEEWINFVFKSFCPTSKYEEVQGWFTELDLVAYSKERTLPPFKSKFFCQIFCFFNTYDILKNPRFFVTLRKGGSSWENEVAKIFVFLFQFLYFLSSMITLFLWGYCSLNVLVRFSFSIFRAWITTIISSFSLFEFVTYFQVGICYFTLYRIVFEGNFPCFFALLSFFIICVIYSNHFLIFCCFINFHIILNSIFIRFKFFLKIFKIF